MKARAVLGKTQWCSICGLRIPDCIVSPDHPLFGTVDHVIPRSLGGSNALANRRPAHRWCNQQKSSRLELTANMVPMLHQFIQARLSKVGVEVKRIDIQNAKKRITVPIKEAPQQHRPALSQQERHLFAWQRWEDDGGPVAGNNLFANL